MRAPRDQADIDPRLRELHTEISADRAGAVDTDLHDNPSISQWRKISAQFTGWL
jgi:hypothetical protein